MEQSATPAPAPERSPEKSEDGLHFFNRFLKIASYPIALVSGLWVAKNDIRETVYHNLKRYGAFDDMLDILTNEM